MAEHQIFVSYSHHDASLVQPLVKLLRVAPTFVFLDSDSIKPGEQWRTSLEQAIARASLMVVFWCHHSNQSAEVEREYRAALAGRKDIVPVLLDSTPVPDALGAYQWIDFRELAAMNHGGALTAAAPEPASAEVARPAAPRMSVASNLLPWLVAAMLVVMAGVWRSWLVAIAALALVAIALLRGGIYRTASGRTRSAAPPVPAREHDTRASMPTLSAQQEWIAGMLLQEISHRSGFPRRGELVRSPK